jgi:hypothetical protein
MERLASVGDFETPSILVMAQNVIDEDDSV